MLESAFLDDDTTVKEASDDSNACAGTTARSRLKVEVIFVQLRHQDSLLPCVSLARSVSL